jgi:hypothetical protein
MLNFIIKTHRVGTIYTKPHLFVLNKGMNSGKPQKEPFTNSFVVIFQNEEDCESLYFVAYSLWKTKFWHPYLVGSVIPFFLNKRKSGVLPITDPNMTRFNISLQGGVDMVMHALFHAWGGEIFIPKIPSYRITDVAEAVGPECKHEVIGIRPGEKVHEEMITPSDSFYTYDLGKYYTILPTSHQWSLDEFINEFNAVKVPQGFYYNSGENTEWETVEGLRELIKEHVDSTFNTIVQ